MSQTVSTKNEIDQQTPGGSPQEEAHPISRPYAWYVFTVLFLATLFNALDSNVFTSAAPVIAREMHLGISSIGFLTGAFTIFLTISIIPVGLWADRTRRSYVIAACLAFWSLATTLTALAGNFFSLFLTRMFTGIGEAGYYPAGNSLVADLFSKKQTPRILSWLALATLIGAIAGIVSGGIIAGLGRGTWHLAFLFTGIPGLLLAICAWRMREPARKQAKASAESSKYSGISLVQLPQQMRTLASNKALVCVTIYGVMVEFTSVGLQTYFPALLQQRDAFGLSSGQAATFAGLALGPTALIGVIFGGYLASWLRRRYQSANFLLCVVSTIITAPLNFITLLVIFTHNLVLFTIVMLPSFLANTSHIGPLSAAVLDIAPKDQRASTVAIFLFVVRILGTALAPITIGVLSSALNPNGQDFAQGLAGHDLTLALLLTCPIIFIIASTAGVIGLRLMRKQQEQEVVV